MGHVLYEACWCIYCLKDIFTYADKFYTYIYICATCKLLIPLCYFWCRILDYEYTSATLSCWKTVFSSRIALSCYVWQEDFSAQRSFKEAEKKKVMCWPEFHLSEIQVSTLDSRCSNAPEEEGGDRKWGVRKYGTQEEGMFFQEEGKGLASQPPIPQIPGTSLLPTSSWPGRSWPPVRLPSAFAKRRQRLYPRDGDGSDSFLPNRCIQGIRTSCTQCPPHCNPRGCYCTPRTEQELCK